MSIDVQEALAKVQAVMTGHFVYKKGSHGAGYINKEALVGLSAHELHELYKEVGAGAVRNGLNINDALPDRAVAVLGPAYGAIPVALSVAVGLEEWVHNVRFFPARTEVERNEHGKRIHALPDKLLALYSGCDLIIVEDIVNNGTTIREVAGLIKSFNSDMNVIGAVSLVDRGGQTAESLGAPQYHPLLRVNMEQHDPREHQCPLCAQGVPINTILGKGGGWVEMFGQPPYPEGTDFSRYWEEK